MSKVTQDGRDEGCLTSSPVLLSQRYCLPKCFKSTVLSGTVVLATHKLEAIAGTRTIRPTPGTGRTVRAWVGRGWQMQPNLAARPQLPGGLCSDPSGNVAFDPERSATPVGIQTGAALDASSASPPLLTRLELHAPHHGGPSPSREVWPRGKPPGDWKEREGTRRRWLFLLPSLWVAMAASTPPRGLTAPVRGALCLSPGLDHCPLPWRLSLALGDWALHMSGGFPAWAWASRKWSLTNLSSYPPGVCRPGLQSGPVTRECVRLPSRGTRRKHSPPRNGEAKGLFFSFSPSLPPSLSSEPVTVDTVLTCPTPSG